MRLTERYIPLLLLVFVLGVSGCSGTPQGKAYKVSGTVKFADGSPLTKGTINFAGDKATAMGQIKEDGTYFLTTYKSGDGAPAGKYQVFFTGECMGGYPPAEKLIHDKFGDREKSGLEKTVEEKTQTIDIVVDKP